MSTIRFQSVIVLSVLATLAVAGCAAESEEPEGEAQGEEDELKSQAGQPAKAACTGDIGGSTDTSLCIKNDQGRTIQYASLGVQPGSILTTCITRKVDGFKACKDFKTENLNDLAGFSRSLTAHFRGLEPGKNYTIRVTHFGSAAGQPLTFQF